MSGGSQNYVYAKVRDLVDDLFHNDTKLSKQKVEQVKKLYTSMSEFMRSVEWVESGDCGYEDLDNALKQFKSEVSEILKD